MSYGAVLEIAKWLGRSHGDEGVEPFAVGAEKIVSQAELDELSDNAKRLLSIYNMLTGENGNGIQTVTVTNTFVSAYMRD